MSMVIIPYHKYVVMPKHQRETFVGIILQQDNSAICYQTGEEKKYQRALKKKEKQSVEPPNLLLF